MPHLKKVLFLFLITCLSCGCFQRGPVQKHAHYELGFSLTAPENWRRADIGSLATVSSLGLEDGKEGLVILTQNFETAFKKQVRLISRTNFPILENGTLLFSKYKTRWFLSTNDKTSNITYVIKADEEQTFSIVCTAPKTNFASYRRTFDRIARSFRTF
jgi:hypothetical protein